MLRTTIQTTDEETGQELPVPDKLLAKVRRAADLLPEVLGKVGEKFDIEARWWFEQRNGNCAAVLRLTSAAGGTSTSEVPSAELGDDATIRRWLWTPTGNFVNILSEEVNHQISGVFREIYATLAELRNEYAGEIAQPADRGTLQTNP
jgi:hypothetical protein